MNGKDLSRQLGDLPVEMIAEAMAPANDTKRKNLTTRVLRMAACFAAVVGLLTAALGLYPSDDGIVTGPGLLAVTVYAADLSSSATLSADSVLPIDYQWSLGTNWLPGQSITLSVSDSDSSSENITFQIIVDGGGFYTGVGDAQYSHQYGDHILFTSAFYKAMEEQFTVSNNTTIYWNPTIGASEEDMFFAYGTTAFADIIIFDEEKIIGFTVLRF